MWNNDSIAAEQFEEAMTPEEKAKMYEAIGYHEGQGDPTLPTEVTQLLSPRTLEAFINPVGQYSAELILIARHDPLQFSVRSPQPVVYAQQPVGHSQGHVIARVTLPPDNVIVNNLTCRTRSVGVQCKCLFSTGIHKC